MVYRVKVKRPKTAMKARKPKVSVRLPQATKAEKLARIKVKLGY